MIGKKGKINYLKIKFKLCIRKIFIIMYIENSIWLFNVYF